MTITQAKASIWFFFRGEMLTWRAWPMVPRIGESVVLPSYADPQNTVITYTVESVVWDMPGGDGKGDLGCVPVRIFVTRPQKEMDKLDRKQSRKSPAGEV